MYALPYCLNTLAETGAALCQTQCGAHVVMREEEEKKKENESPFPSPSHAEETVLQAGERHES